MHEAYEMYIIQWDDYSDLIPDELLRTTKEIRGYIHLVRGPRGGLSEAKCDVGIVGSRVELNYRPYAKFNDRKGWEIGVLGIYASAKGKGIKKVRWKDGIEGGRWEDAGLEVSYEDDLRALGVSEVEVEGIGFEGRRKIAMHVAAERDKALVKHKKLEALRNDPLLRCEACGCSFKEVYGAVGEGFCEVHHQDPISEGPRVTTKERLSVLCSNCHRMIHRTYPMLSVEEFRRSMPNNSLQARRP
jgi:hypothetical protein